jgi:hypothetical protein
MRTAKVLYNGQWVKMSFVDLKKGDIFQLYEEDGSIVADDDGNDTWIATGDLVLVDDVYGIYGKAYQIA